MQYIIYVSHIIPTDQIHIIIQIYLLSAHENYTIFHTMNLFVSRERYGGVRGIAFLVLSKISFFSSYLYSTFLYLVSSGGKIMSY